MVKAHNSDCGGPSGAMMMANGTAIGDVQQHNSAVHGMAMTRTAHDDEGGMVMRMAGISNNSDSDDAATAVTEACTTSAQYCCSP